MNVKIIIIAVLSALTLPTYISAAIQKYNITDLGSLSQFSSSAISINENGQVVGWSDISNDSWYAFIWHNGSIKNLGTLIGPRSDAADINEYGQIVGNSTANTLNSHHAIMWENGNIRDLGTLFPSIPSASSYAYGINDLGEVVGESESRAFLWKNGAMQDLGAFVAKDINTSGQIAGTNDGSGAILWQNGTIQDLGTLGGTQSSVNSINDAGQIVGMSYISNNSYYHATLWQNGTIVDLGNLGGSGNSKAYSINNSGQIVGMSNCANSGNGCNHAFLWQNGIIYDLNDLLTANSGWVVHQAHGINDKGQIVGTGSYNGNLAWHAFLMTPIVVPTTINVSKSGSGSGTVTSNPIGINCGAICTADFNSGTQVTLTATPDTGYSFTGWSGDCNNPTGTCTVTMDTAKNVTALFANLPTYTLSVAKVGAGTGTITSSPAGINCGATCSAGFTSGQTVTLTATATNNSAFAGWNPASCASLFNLTADTTCTANFTSNTYTLTVNKTGTGSGAVGGGGIYAYNSVVTPTATAAAGSTFAGWSPTSCASPFNLTADTTCTATFTLNSYTLTVAKSGNGSGTVGGGGSFPYNTQVTPTATAATGSTFTGWNPTSCASPFNLTADTTCTANFTLNNYTLTVAKTGNGSGTVSGGGSFPYNTSVTPTATAAAGSAFAGWTPASCASPFNLTANTTCTANFTSNTYTLTVNKTGTGSGAVGGGGIYAYNSVVTPTATAAAGSTFAGWSPVSCASPFNLTTDTTCTATFTLNNYTLTVAQTGTGSGTVGGGGSFAYNTSVTPTAIAAAGSTFSGWNPTSCANPFNLTANTTCTASFALRTYPVTAVATPIFGGSIKPASQTVNHNAKTTFTIIPATGYQATVSGCGGTLNSVTRVYTTGPITAACRVVAAFKPSLTVVKTGSGAGLITAPGINCGTVCTTAYPLNTAVLLTAREAAGSKFAGWIGCTVNPANLRQCTTTMNVAKTVQARFTATAAGKTALTVYKAGPGFGTVVSAPAGISCAPTCGTGVAYFANSATVTLTATPATGSTFAGWTGCAVNPTKPRQCTVSLNTGKVVITRFSRPGLTEGEVDSGGVNSVPDLSVDP